MLTADTSAASRHLRNGASAAQGRGSAAQILQDHALRSPNGDPLVLMNYSGELGMPALHLRVPDAK
jgi:hypothetical protein